MGFCWLSLVTKYYCGMSCISDVHPYGREKYIKTPRNTKRLTPNNQPQIPPTTTKTRGKLFSNIVAKLNNCPDIKGPIALNPNIILPKLKHTNGNKVNQVPSLIPPTPLPDPFHNPPPANTNKRIEYPPVNNIDTNPNQ